MLIIVFANINHDRLKIIIFSQSFFKNSNAIAISVFLKIQVRISAFMINIAQPTVVMSKKKGLSYAPCHYVYMPRFLEETGTTTVVSYVLKNVISICTLSVIHQRDSLKKPTVKQKIFHKNVYKWTDVDLGV